MSGSNSISVVTGGSRGLGLAITHALLGAGRRVVVLSRTISKELETSIANHPGTLFHISVDFTKSFEASDIFAKVCELGSPSEVIFNAAMGSNQLFVLQSESDIQQLCTVNFVAPLFLARAFAKQFVRQRSGSMVFISSLAGRRALRGLAIYGALKAGLEHMVRTLALELGSYGIRVNGVAPGFLRTDMTSVLDESQLQRAARRNALGRETDTTLVAQCVMQLLGENFAATTGAIIPVDSGSGL